MDCLFCLSCRREEEISELLLQQQRIYCGFDPTSDSLHFGNLLPVICLLQLTREGHQPICVIGDATASIGDPSGRVREREALSGEIIKENSQSISSDLSKVFANHFKYFWKASHNSPLNDPM